MIESIIILWIICGVLAYGRTLADFQRSYPIIAHESRRSDMVFAFIIGCTGPIGLFISLLLTIRSKTGWMWRIK